MNAEESAAGARPPAGGRQDAAGHRARIIAHLSVSTCGVQP